MFHIEPYDYHKHFKAISSLKLTEIDLIEIYGMTGCHADRTSEILKKSLEVSKYAYVVFDKTNKVLCGCFGVTEDSKHEGSPWLLSDGSLSDLPFSLCKQARAIVNKWISEDSFCLLINFVSVQNIRSQKWLSVVLGFTIDTSTKYTLNGVDFYRFYKKGTDC